MAFAQTQPTVQLTAETTFSSDDLYKFVSMSTTNGRISIVESTAPNFVVGTLLSETFSTSTGADEAVTVGLLSGIGKVYMAGSTLATGATIGCSTNGFGVIASATTDTMQVGMVVSGTSGTTGRIFAVLFQAPITAPSTSAGY